jgi:hypothetical protein
MESLDIVKSYKSTGTTIFFSRFIGNMNVLAEQSHSEIIKHFLLFKVVETVTKGYMAFI